MKRCPECRRDYYDDTLLYCLDDGNALLEGPALAGEPSTVILPAFGMPDVISAGELLTRNLPSDPLSDPAGRDGEEGFRIAVLPFKLHGTDVALLGMAWKDR